MLARLAPVMLALVIGACGSNTTGRPVSSSPTSANAVASSATTTSSQAETQSTTTLAPPDFTRFIAAVDTALVETAYAGAALTDPEVFIATGQLFCELLDAGASQDEILSEHLDALAAVGNGEVTDADATATGVVLGASTEVICPQHAG